MDSHLEQDNNESFNEGSDLKDLDQEDEIPSGIFKTIPIPKDEDISELVKRLDIYQREVINIGVKFAKDVVKAQRLDNPYPKAPLLMAHGSAGAGKSSTIHTLVILMQKILRQEDDDVNSPCIRNALT